MVYFDYCLLPGAEVNFVIRSGGYNWEVRCNSKQNKGYFLSALAGIVADGQWHRGGFDLHTLTKAPAGVPLISN
jgi:hypothetical protein